MIRWLAPHDLQFPDTAQALGPPSEAAGLLAAGGDLRVERLRAAYRRGIFPWFARGQPPLWWSPDPRMVLQVTDFKVSRSLRKTLARFARTPGCEIRIDSAFERVIGACSATPRAGQDDTWIVPEMVAAYTAWHRAGQVHSVECWMDGELAGGLYGVHLGRMFFGESMFAHRTDASKIALSALVAFCRTHGIDWIDCQQQTDHLASLGAAPVPRAVFEAHLRETVDQPGPTTWTYDESMWQAVLPQSGTRPVKVPGDAPAPSDQPPPA